mgnify:CR=1 FL=1
MRHAKVNAFTLAVSDDDDASVKDVTECPTFITHHPSPDRQGRCLCLVMLSCVVSLSGLVRPLSANKKAGW